MPINAGLADISNGLLLTTLILYAVAMLCYACDFAFARQRVMAGITEPEVAAVRKQVPELVGVGAGGPASPPKADHAPATPVGDEPASSRWPSGFWRRLAFSLTCTGVVLHVAAILTRGLAEHRVPWGNMYEFI